jgi:excisionase family DNA binding protein
MAQASPTNPSKQSGLPPATISLADFAGLLGISYTTAHEMAQRGELPVTPIRVGRKYRFTIAAVNALLGTSLPTGIGAVAH